MALERVIWAVSGLQWGSQIEGLWSLVMDAIDLRGGEGLGTNLDGRRKLFLRKNHARQKRSCLRGFWAVLVVLWGAKGPPDI